MRIRESFVALLVSVMAPALITTGIVVLTALTLALTRGELVKCHLNELQHVFYSKPFRPGPGGRDYVVSVASWRDERTAFLGELKSDCVVRKGSTYEKQILSRFDEQVPVYEVYPSVTYFVFLRVSGGIVCLLIGCLLGVAARDIWCVEAIRSGNRRSWMLWLKCVKTSSAANTDRNWTDRDIRG